MSIPGKALWKFSQTIEWIQIGALSVTSQRFTVQFDTTDGLQTWLIKISKSKDRKKRRD